MKLKLPAYEPLLKGNEHLKHGEINIDLGENVVRIVRCKDCANGCHKTETSVVCKVLNKLMLTTDYCSYGARSDTE